MLGDLLIGFVVAFGLALAIIIIISDGGTM